MTGVRNVIVDFLLALFVIPLLGSIILATSTVVFADLSFRVSDHEPAFDCRADDEYKQCQVEGGYCGKCEDGVSIDVPKYKVRDGTCIVQRVEGTDGSIPCSGIVKYQACLDGHQASNLSHQTGTQEGGEKEPVDAKV